MTAPHWRKFKFAGYTKLTPEQVTAMQPHVTEPVNGDHYWSEYTGDVMAVMDALPGVAIELIPGAIPVPVWLELMAELKALGVAVGTGQTRLNDRVNVVVPDLGLLQMRRVAVRTDYCTESLQLDLDRGWRILAICPQPDQRRPDYVLGFPGVDVP